MKKVKTAVALGTFIALGIGAKVEAETVPQSGVNRIHFINTKGSPGTDAILLESNGHYALIDMGEDYDFPDGSNPLYPLRVGTMTSNFYAIEDRLFRHMSQVGVPKLDFMLGTHVHSDHIGGADEVLQRYKVDKFYLKRYTDDRISTQWGLWDNLFNYNNALNAARKYGVNVVQDISDKDSHFKLGDMDIQLYNYKNEYGPDGKLKKVYDDNPNSIVAVITVNGKKIYLGGDLDNVYGAEDRLGPQIGKVDLMKWNHHLDGKVSNTINFLDNLKPSIVVQTTGLDINVQATRDKLKQMNVQLIHASSDRKDATVFDITKDGINNISQEFPDIQSTNARWVTEDGFKKYYFGDGQMATGWHTFDGDKYFFNGKGHLQQNKWIQDFNAEGTLKSLFMDKDGKLQTSKWLLLDNHWYYVDARGYRMESELAIINGKTYYFDDKGIMQTGSRVVNGVSLYFDSTGALSGELKPLSWNKIGNKWYYLDENKNMTIGFKEIDGKMYFFNESGEMGTNWQYTLQKWYYFGDSGEMKYGWLKDAGKWYYLEPKTGEMAIGVKKIDGIEYRFNDGGVMATGWETSKGKWYYYTTSGELKKGWLKYNNEWYYFEPKDGVMVTGVKEIDGQKYSFKDSGAMATGWKQTDGKWYYYAASGEMKRGWLKDAGKWYYLDPKDGVMVTGVKEIDGQKYSFKDSGAMETGWKQTEGKWYYYAVSGEMKKGWIKDAGKWYYLDYKDGAMVTGRQEVDGVKYSFNQYGAMETGWVSEGSDWYHYKDSGAMETGWFKYTGKWFFFDYETGKMVTGMHEVSGDNYYFNKAGEMQVGWIQDKGEWYYFKASGAMLRNGTTPDGYKVDEEGRWLPNGVTTTTTTTTTTSTTETTTAEETTQEKTTQETTVESTTAEPTTEQKTIPINSDKTSEITDANEIG